MTLGALIIYRIWNNKSEIVQNRRKFLFFFAGLIIFSGILSFLLDKSWFKTTGTTIKIPLYGIGELIKFLFATKYLLKVGTSLTFALIFTMIDLINIVCGFFQKTYSKLIVESYFQVFA